MKPKIAGYFKESKFEIGKPVILRGVRFNNKKGGYDVRIPNLSLYTNKRMWIRWKNLKKMMCVKKNIGPEYGFFRIYYLDPLYQMKGKENEKNKLGSG